MIIDRMSNRLIKKKKNQSKVIVKNGKNILHGNMAHCFDMRRTSSFDLHDIGQDEEVEPKSSFLSKLFRSRSESTMKKKATSPGQSPKTSPKPSPGAPRRRRFARVIKNDEQVGEEYVNPHVVRKYDKGFWESSYMKKSASLDEPERRPLPYTVTGQTILKKAQSVDLDHHPSSGSSSPCGTPPHFKTCKFAEDVEIVEYDIQSNCDSIRNGANIHTEKLHDNTLEFCMDMELLETPYSDKCSLRVSVEPSDLCETHYKLESLEVIDEHSQLLTTGTQTTEEEGSDDVFRSDSSDSISETSSTANSDIATESRTLMDESCDRCDKNTEEKATQSPPLSKKDVKDTPTKLTPPVSRKISGEESSAPKKSKIHELSLSSVTSTSDNVEEMACQEVRKTDQS